MGSLDIPLVRISDLGPWIRAHLLRRCFVQSSACFRVYRLTAPPFSCQSHFDIPCKTLMLIWQVRFRHPAVQYCWLSSTAAWRSSIAYTEPSMSAFIVSLAEKEKQPLLLRPMFENTKQKSERDRTLGTPSGLRRNFLEHTTHCYSAIVQGILNSHARTNMNFSRHLLVSYTGCFDSVYRCLFPSVWGAN